MSGLPTALTGYLLSIAAGGAAGGLLVAIAAPRVFPDYFDLQAALFVAVVLRAAEHLGFAAVVVDDSRDEATEDQTGAYGSDWVLLARDPALLARSPIAEATSEPPEIPPGLAEWTDESSALLPVLLVDEDSPLARLMGR